MNTDVIPVPAKSGTTNPILDLFHTPKTDISISDFLISTFSPVGTSITPLEFNIPEVKEFVDLNRSYFTLKLKLTKKKENRSRRLINCT